MRDGVNQLPVMTDGELQVMLAHEKVITFLSTQLKLMRYSEKEKRDDNIRIMNAE